MSLDRSQMNTLMNSTASRKVPHQGSNFMFVWSSGLEIRSYSILLVYIYAQQATGFAGGAPYPTTPSARAWPCERLVVCLETIPGPFARGTSARRPYDPDSNWSLNSPPRVTKTTTK